MSVSEDPELAGERRDVEGTGKATWTCLLKCSAEYSSRSIPQIFGGETSPLGLGSWGSRFTKIGVCLTQQQVHQ